MSGQSQRHLDREIALLRQRLEVAEEMRRAIVEDEVDGFIVGKDGSEPKLVLLETARAGQRLLLERMHQGALTVSDNGQILYANQRFAAQVGKPLAQLFAADLCECVVPSDRDRLRRFLATSTPDATIEVVLCGAVMPVASRLTVVSVGEGHIWLLVTDLSARERLVAAESARQAIRNGEIDGVVAGDKVMLVGDAERPYRALADRMQQGAATVSAQGDLLYMNEPFAAMVGVARERLLGQSIFPLFNRDAPLRDALQGAASPPCELAIQRGDGQQVPVAVEWERVAGTDALMLVVTDLTEHKQHQALAAEAARKDRFLAVLAHELRNPLASIRHATAVLQHARELNEDGRFSVQVIERQTTTLVRLVDDLLDIHRMNEGRILLRRQPVDLVTVIRDAIEAARPYLEDKRHTLDVSMPDDEVFVDADAVRLAQVLLNLLSNAAKFTAKGGRIAIAVERVRNASFEEVARVRVADNGIGVPRELLEHIFDPYVQVSPSSGRGAGLGLGLSVARRLVELHDGSIRAQSDGLGRGTTFTIELPACAQPAQTHAPNISESAPGGTLRILVADDSEDNAHSLAMLLRLDGHEVRIANDGVEALSVADQFKPDVAFLDIDMPGMDGYDIARALRARPWAANVILFALTGWGSDDDRQRAREAGFNSHFVKPVSVELLASTIEAHRAQPTPPA